MELGLSDTDSAAADVQIDLLRRASPDERLRLALSLSATIIGLSRDGIRRREPTLAEADVGLRFVEIQYGAALADAIRARLRESPAT